MDIVKELDPLFNPRSIAVIGASNNFNKWGFSTFSSVVGKRQKAYPVNWKEEKVIGHKAYKRVVDIPDPIDLAIFVIPAKNIPSVMEDCVEKGVKAGVIIAAGFKEAGEKELEDDVVRIARKGGLRFVGPNCMGMWSASSDLLATMFPMPAVDGPIGFVSQGGNVGGALVMSAIARGVGFRSYVSCGIAADIQIEEYIEYFGKDPNIKVIMAYIEGLNDGRRFIEKTREAAIRKPVVVLKPGKSDATARAIKSHSGALSGSHQNYEAAFKTAGAIMTDDTEEFLDVAIGFLTQPLPKGRNVGIISPGGSYGVLSTDACESRGLKVVDLPKDVITEFNKIFPSRWSHGNPVDPAGDRDFITYLKAPTTLLGLDEMDSLIFMGFGGFSGFGSTFTSFREMSALKGIMDMAGSVVSSIATDEFVGQILSMVTSGDISQIKELVELIAPPLADIFHVSDVTLSMEELIEEYVDILTPIATDLYTAIRNNDPLILPMINELSGDFMPLMSSISGGGKVSFSKMMSEMGGGLIEKMDLFIGMIILPWIKKYGKPIVTTTFTEATSRMAGNYHPYSSGERAAKVLSSLAEYKEYLDERGVYKKKAFDPLEFCLL
ncbi:MAG: succinyl-CoA synthetase subunit alpha [Candidatus Methanolliviera sp. GoM_oil]|nr:MAG: succinyl-CoA synthetase subunit alpha [Candidatus Methanolliviera sp. GoM_oil]